MKIDYSKKGYKIAVFALVIALLALSAGSGITNTNTTIVNQTVGLNIVVNNTNLAPNSTDSVGTGERIEGVTYYANETPIDIYVFAHAASAGQTAELHLFINGTKLQDQSGRPIGVAEQTNSSVDARIPLYASYKIEASNVHHYEWREYRVISGQNGSVNLTNNYYNISGIDNTSLNLKVNKSGDTMTGDLNMNDNYIYNTTAIENNGYQLQINSFFGNNSLIHLQSNQNTIDITDTETTFLSGVFVNSNITTNSTLNFTVQNNTISFISDNGASQVLKNETGGSTSSASETGYILWARFNSSETYNSTMLALNIFSFSAGANMRMAIYNGNGSNAPYQLLSESSSQAITSTGWNNISYPQIQINGSSTEYWIAMQTQNVAVVYYASGTGKYKAQAYGAFPSTAGSTLTTDAINMRIYSDVGIVQKRYCLRATYTGALYTVEC